jgi:hypothetical protein
MRIESLPKVIIIAVIKSRSARITGIQYLQTNNLSLYIFSLVVSLKA